MATSLASQIREGFEEAAHLLGDRAELVVRARASRNERSGNRDRLLGAIVAEYRSGERKVWGPVLLELLTPGLLQTVKRYRPEPPGIDPEDIRQQLVVELLRAAEAAPLPLDAAFVERRLLLRAGQGVRRWLVREARWRGIHQALEADLEEER